MLIYLWIPQSPAQTDAIIRESSAILLFLGVVETKKFEAFPNGPDSAGFPNCGLGGLSSPPFHRMNGTSPEPAGWKTCATFGFEESLDLQPWTRIGAKNLPSGFVLVLDLLVQDRFEDEGRGRGTRTEDLAEELFMGSFDLQNRSHEPERSCRQRVSVLECGDGVFEVAALG
jgi:hypothetical protein